jgi:hypothetical protein
MNNYDLSEDGVTIDEILKVSSRVIMIMMIVTMKLLIRPSYFLHNNHYHIDGLMHTRSE